jgi:hypothetical protein
MVSKNTKTEPAPKSVTKTSTAKQSGGNVPPVVATEPEKKGKKAAPKKEPEPVKVE